MKLSAPLLLFFITVIAFLGCAKQNNDLPAHTGHVAATGTSNTSSGSLTTATAITYPYTTGYIGDLVISYVYSFADRYDSTDKSFIFNVIHIDTNTLVFSAARSFPLERAGYASMISIQDTVIRNASGTYVSDLHLFMVEHNYPVLGKSVTFQLSGNNLSVSWSENYVPLLGGCDYGISSGQFNGVLTR